MLITAQSATEKSVRNFNENFSQFGEILGPINEKIQEATVKGNFECLYRTSLSGEATTEKVIAILSALGYKAAFYKSVDGTPGGIYQIQWGTL